MPAALPARVTLWTLLAELNPLLSNKDKVFNLSEYLAAPLSQDDARSKGDFIKHTVLSDPTDLAPAIYVRVRKALWTPAELAVWPAFSNDKLSAFGRAVRDARQAARQAPTKQKEPVDAPATDGGDEGPKAAVEEQDTKAEEKDATDGRDEEPKPPLEDKPPGKKGKVSRQGPPAPGPHPAEQPNRRSKRKITTTADQSAAGDEHANPTAATSSTDPEPPSKRKRIQSPLPAPGVVPATGPLPVHGGTPSTVGPKVTPPGSRGRPPGLRPQSPAVQTTLTLSTMAEQWREHTGTLSTEIFTAQGQLEADEQRLDTLRGEVEDCRKGLHDLTRAQGEALEQIKAEYAEKLEALRMEQAEAIENVRKEGAAAVAGAQKNIAKWLKSSNEVYTALRKGQDAYRVMDGKVNSLQLDISKILSP
ncbi:hypothetical protein CALCODRAFT_481329 [Calocera cornea HHB12733]|uniref:Uncharacterized protein n=1 Tax=Calocera cornea HHB12733 TaxID=1353952 RepID=A0A165HQP6_9BASI|nr:hypothetical protein CALCODRAFT_481329 [Calocera cornea HHB12733]